MKLPLIIGSLLFTSLFSTAQPPQGYYESANGLFGTSLQQALHDIIDNHTVISYDALYDAFLTTDKKPNGKVWDMYSDVPGGTPAYEYTFSSSEHCGSYNEEGDCFNREHSWPKSWFSDQTPMYSDLFHLYPTDGYVNNRRSNYPFGTVNSPEWTSSNGSKVGGCSWPGYSGTAFEPIDAYKGDFARTYFYMATRYYNEDNGWAGSSMTDGSQLKSWARTMLLQWSQQDPVSQKEIDRNNAVYAIQHNRNPFIDNPQYALSIWDPNSILVETPSTLVLDAYPNPSSTSCRINLPFNTSKQSPEILFYSTTSQLVQVPVKWNGEVVEINLDNISTGVYFVRMSFEKNKQIYVSRILKK